MAVDAPHPGYLVAHAFGLQHVRGIHFTDEISLWTATRIADEARAMFATIPAFEVQFGEIVVAHQAIALLAQPTELIQRLRTTSRVAIGRVLGKDHVGEDPDRFRAHVSIAYITADGSAAPYVDAIDGIRPQPVSVPVGHVSLIELHRDHQMWEWATVDRLTLGSHSEPYSGQPFRGDIGVLR